MRYQQSYSLMYAFLIIIVLFAPEEYGVPLKYAFLPLMLMLVLGLLGRGTDLNRVRIKLHFVICLCWIALIIYSTMTSVVVEWSSNARSFCLLILFFALLYEMVPSERCMNRVKYVYIYVTLFCGLWIILQSFGGLDRQNFVFVSGPKDVNYLTAFMLPGTYMAMRFAFIEKQKFKLICILCVATSFVGVLLVQSRAAFITLLSISFFCFWESMSKMKLSKKKIIAFLLIAIVAFIGIGAIWNSTLFTRLTAAESYEDNIRLDIWEYSLKAFHDRPIIGSGLGASNYYGQIAMNHDTHNNYIDILGDSGIIGIALFILLSLQLLKVRKGERLHMFSFFVACMLPLGFINGLQTVSFWFPVLLLAHEHQLIQKGARPTSLQCNNAEIEE